MAACASERVLPDAEPITGIHRAGVLDPDSAAFHGKELATYGWDLAVCMSCHGDDYAGGRAGVSCLDCHPNRPDDCATCHDREPTSGAHVVHRDAGAACSDCHRVPSRWDDEGHVRRAGTADPSPAEVAFGPLAGQTIAPADRAGPPSFAKGRCSNVYCHGAALHAGGGTTTEPVWAAASAGGCVQCHATPPPSHIQTACSTCHRAARHLDGKLDVGTGCNDCHRAAPTFVDLTGSTTSPAAGAHQAHLTGARRLRGPLGCNDCHMTPAVVTAPGHIDSQLPAEVFPPGSSQLARADNAMPVWNRDTATCTGTYCHGNGIYLMADPVAGTLRSPSWTAGQSQVYCGACHGVPPTTHDPTLTLSDCARCHPSVDSTGAPIVIDRDGGSTSLHIDGVVNVF
jgi:predicted CxxxxCH...CXXCH cytochrome family protein